MPTPFAIPLGVVIAGVVLRYFVTALVDDFRSSSPPAATGPPMARPGDPDLDGAVWTSLDDLQYQRCVEHPAP